MSVPGQSWPPHWEQRFRSNASFCGLLWRQGSGSWALEYFVLVESSLFCFGRQDDAHPICVFQIKGALVSRGQQLSERKRFGLNIRTPAVHMLTTGVTNASEQVCRFECSPCEVRDMWATKLQEATQVAPPAGSVAPVPPVRRSSSSTRVEVTISSSKDSGYQSLPQGMQASDMYNTLQRSPRPSPVLVEEPGQAPPSDLPMRMNEADTLLRKSQSNPSMQVEPAPSNAAAIADSPSETYRIASACPPLLVDRVPTRGDKLRQALDTLIADVVKGSKFEGHSGLKLLMERVQRIATVCRTMTEVASNTTGTLAEGSVWFERCKDDIEAMTASLKDFVQAALPVKAHGEAYPEDLTSGALLHFEAFTTFKSTAGALGLLASQVFQALDVFPWMQKCIAILRTEAEDFKLRDSVQQAQSHLQALVDSVNRQSKEEYVQCTKQLSGGSQDTVKQLMAASKLLGACLPSGGTFWDLPAVVSHRARIVDNTKALLEATKRSVGVWTTAGQNREMLSAAYSLTASHVQLLAYLQTVPAIWDQLSLSKPSRPVSRASISSRSSIGSLDENKENVYQQLNEAFNISASIAVTITNCTRELSKLTSSEMDVTTDAGKETGAVVLSLVGQIQSEIEALELVGLSGDTLDSLAEIRDKFNFTSNELTYAMASATGKWPQPDALVRVHQQAVAMLRVSEALASIVADIVSQQKKALQDIQLRRRALRRQKQQQAQLNKLEDKTLAPPPEREQSTSLEVPVVPRQPRPSSASTGSSSTETTAEEVLLSSYQLPPEPLPHDLILQGDTNLVKCGSLERLVERMTYHEHPDTHMTRAFLLTYRSFTDPETLLEMLIARYNLKPPDSYSDMQKAAFEAQRVTPVRLRVFNVLKGWINTGITEFRTNEALCSKLNVFLTAMALTLARASQNLSKLLAKRLSEAENAAAPAGERDLKDAPMPVLPQILPPAASLNLLHLSPLEVARQMTILDWKYFRAIQPRECLDEAWTKPDKNLAPNIQAMIQRANSVSNWVTSTVLSKDNADERGVALSFFVTLVDHLLSLHNFHAGVAIFASLNNAALHRLKKTRNKLPSELKEIFAKHEATLISSSNYAEYRKRLHSIDPPCIPFLGVYLTDLVMVENGNKNKIKVKNPENEEEMIELINFDKRRKIATVIEEMQRYQQLGYVLQPLSIIQEHFELMKIETASEEEQYARSLELEPRESKAVGSPSTKSRKKSSIKNPFKLSTKRHSSNA